jgi:hypothetical protein
MYQHSMEQLAVQYGAPTPTAQYDIDIANNMTTKMKLLLRFNIYKSTSHFEYIFDHRLN